MSARLRCRALLAAWLLAMIFAALGASVAPAAGEPAPITITDVTFVGSGGVILHGLVVAPTPSGKRRPALVMLEGAGNRGRHELQPAAEVFARRGVITLIYDKRKVGYSLLRRDYGLLAADAIAAVALLATRPDVDPSRLGLWAQSEGAYVAPLACLGVERSQVRGHSRRGRGDSSGADRLGLRPVSPPRGCRRRAPPTPWRSLRFGP
jgi:hypothetical protein